MQYIRVLIAADVQGQLAGYHDFPIPMNNLT